MKDSRYPYTYACDYIRNYGGYGEHGANLSRSDASAIRGAISKAIGMDDSEMAAKIADYYLKNEEEINGEAAKKLMIGLGIPNFQTK